MHWSLCSHECVTKRSNHWASPLAAGTLGLTYAHSFIHELTERYHTAGSCCGLPSFCLVWIIPLSPHPTPDFLGGHIKSDLPCSAQNFTCVIFAKEFCLLDILERSVNCTTGFSPLLLAISDWSVALTFISTVPALLYSDLRSKPHRSQKLFLLTPQVLDQSFILFKAV